MKAGGYLDESVDVDELAKQTKNYTGAEIEGVCKAAASYAFERNIDKSSMDRPADAAQLCVMMEDFGRAIAEVKPAFGVSTEELELCCPNGIMDYGTRFQHILSTGRKFLAQVRDSENTPLLSVLMEGQPGAGKTALAASLAAEAGYPYTKLISAESLVNLSESAKCYKITKAFEDAYRSPLSVIVLDNIERLVGYVKIGPRFSNEILQVALSPSPSSSSSPHPSCSTLIFWHNYYPCPFILFVSFPPSPKSWF
jgi:vesicle-fusing ATPase